MSIVTKTGDKGMTSLCCGTRVMKDDMRIETCGALDEALSFLGMAKSFAKNGKTKSIADCVQRELMVICSEVAAAPDAVNRLKKRISRSSVCILEKEIGRLENKYNIEVKTFSIQGENAVSAALDIARAVTRRAERRCVTMTRKNMLKNRNIIVYLNRLSDLLYLLARFNEKK